MRVKQLIIVLLNIFKNTIKAANLTALKVKIDKNKKAARFGQLLCYILVFLILLHSKQVCCLHRSILLTLHCQNVQFV